nr:immunoglobulin heavy chain junction region [Mus musculus]
CARGADYDSSFDYW